jgi:eukaryotic-like serine/threonine-protein kinase
MRQAQWEQIEALFAELVSLGSKERAQFLDRACTDRPELRAELESLLTAHDTESGPLDAPVSLGENDVDVAGELPAGTRLGPWQVLNLIGRGGMGEVYLAMRADGAFQQRVAVKLLAPGSVAESTRFQSEREILARLQHPGIARLLDGGVFRDGRPYMVMEYVEGLPLAEYCAKEKLDRTARLKLFMEVCDVVSYAHRSLIVHRDLKHGNILVNREGRVKLLDFGIAKLLDAVAVAGADEKTSAPLTPSYAAPEQLTGKPITTATDVYAIGIVLFELLTGRRPFHSSDMPVAQAVRSLLHEKAPTASRMAQVHPDSPVPAAQIAGDLDAIVAKCLRKEPEHRYESVGALQRDIQRHLNAEPVTAREGARLYVMGRFLRRHRWSVAAVTAFVLSLAVGLAVVSWQAHRIALERDIAKRAATREEAVRYYLTRMFRNSVANGGGPEPTTAKNMLDRSAQRVLAEYRDDPYLAGKVVETLADLYGALGDVEGQAPLLEGFIAQAGPEANPESLALVRQKLANVELLLGHVPRAAELLDPAEAYWKTDPQRYAEQRLEGLVVRGRLQRAQGDMEGSIATYQVALRGRIALSGRDHAETATLYNSLAITYAAANRLDEALRAYRQALAIHETLGRSDELDALVMRGNMGTLAYRLGRIDEAEEMLRNAFEKQRALSGDSAAVAAAMSSYGSIRNLRRRPDAPEILSTAMKMGIHFAGPGSPVAVQARLLYGETLFDRGQREAALAALKENLAIARKQLGANHLLVLRTRLGLARIALTSGDVDRAEKELAELETELRKQGVPAVLALAQTLITRADALLAQGNAPQAVTLLNGALQIREQILWAQSWEIGEARERLGEALAELNDPRAKGLLASAMPILDSQLGPDHPLSIRARKAAGI